MDLEAELQSLANRLPDREDERFRLFACDCARRAMEVFAHPHMGELISFGESRAVRATSPTELQDLGERSDPIYQSVDPGHSAPSAQTLALCAAAEVAFTSSPLKAAIHGADFAARAVAEHQTAHLNDDYDVMFDRAYVRECEAQQVLLKERFGLTDTQSHGEECRR